MTTMDQLRGVYLAGLLVLPLIYASNSTTSEYTPTGTEGAHNNATSSTSSEPTTANKGPSTLISVTPDISSTTQPPSLTNRGSDAPEDTTSPQTTAGNTPLLTTTAQPTKTAAIAGYIFLGIIVVAVPVLCWLLLCFWRKSRWYSFDFKYPVLLMDPPGTFETVNMEEMSIGAFQLDLPASNGECLSGPGDAFVPQVVPPSSGCLPLDTEQTDTKWDQSASLSLHNAEEEQDDDTLSYGSTAP